MKKVPAPVVVDKTWERSSDPFDHCAALATSYGSKTAHQCRRFSAYRFNGHNLCVSHRFWAERKELEYVQ